MVPQAFSGLGLGEQLSRVVWGLQVRLETAVPKAVPGRGGAQSPLRHPFPCTPSHTLPGRWRVSPLAPRGSPPGRRVNSARVCAADVSLGHEHDFRVKHLSEALNDKHGPLAGEYTQPSPRAAKAAAPGGLCSEDEPGLSASLSVSLSQVSLLGTRSPCLSPDGSACLALRAWARGRSWCYLEGGRCRAGSPDI